MRFCTVTLGCKANQFDTGTIERALLSRGHENARPGAGCDVCIVNTCAVTAESVRKSRQAVRRMKKLEPNALIAVCGCYSALEQTAAAVLGADIIGDAKDREGFAEKLEKAYNARQNRTPCHAPQTSDCSPPSRRRTRALLKIQDGCDNSCTYCIIPKARGASRSVPLPEIALMAKELEAHGHREIVLTGIEISSFEPRLIDAVRAVSSAAPGARLRLGSLNPDILTPEFIRQLRDVPNLCGHFHLSLQSGCDETLRRMNRKYTTRQVMNAIENLRGTFDNCAVTADLIVGFPGETDIEFEQTMDFIDMAAFSAMHIFPYSPRPGTAAAAMPEQVGGRTKQQRAKLASQKAAALSERFKLAQIGKELEVLFESHRGGHSIGHSGNYLNVAADGKIDKNTVKGVRISGVENGILTGKIV